MDRAAFIETLRRALYGKVDDVSLMEHIHYYEDYIAQETAKGRSEEDILNELGDPRLIARTILETAGQKSRYTEYTVEEKSDTASGSEFRVHQYEGWKAALFMALAAAVVIVLLVLVFQAVMALLPILILAGLAVWLIKKFGR